jgi:CelD/BcsL family acetyltransferase involved in cellulose biosynthesis
MQTTALRSRYEAPDPARNHAQRMRNGVTWTVAEINSVNDISQLKCLLDPIDWADTGVTLFQTSGWLAAAAKAVLTQSDSEVRMVLAKKGDTLVAAMAFSIRKTLGVRIATPLGNPLSQYSDILMEDAAYRQLEPDALRSAFALMHDIDAFWFPRVRDDAKTIKFIRSAGGEQISRSAAPFAELARYPNFNAFLKAHWKAHRNRNRLRRRAESNGSLTFEVTGSAARAAELTRYAVELKRQWLRSRFRLFGTLSSQKWCEALIHAIEFPSSSTRSVVTSLHAHGKPVAIEVGFVRRGRYYAFLGAFDPKFNHWSPTDLLMEDTVRWCFEQNIEYYDLLPPDDPYKAKWTNNSMSVSDWMICRSFAGRLFMEYRRRLLQPLVTRFVEGATWGYQWMRQAVVRNRGESRR